MVAKTSLSFATFITIAIALINEGMNFVKQNPLYGTIIIIVGFAVMVLAAFLYVKGIISVASKTMRGMSHDRPVL